LLFDGIIKFTVTSAHQHRKATVLRKREDSVCNNTGNSRTPALSCVLLQTAMRHYRLFIFVIFVKYLKSAMN